MEKLVIYNAVVRGWRDQDSSETAEQALKRCGNEVSRELQREEFAYHLPDIQQAINEAWLASKELKALDLRLGAVTDAVIKVLQNDGISFT